MGLDLDALELLGGGRRGFLGDGVYGLQESVARPHACRHELEGVPQLLAEEGTTGGGPR